MKRKGTSILYLLFNIDPPIFHGIISLEKYKPVSRSNKIIDIFKKKRAHHKISLAQMQGESQLRKLSKLVALAILLYKLKSSNTIYLFESRLMVKIILRALGSDLGPPDKLDFIYEYIY